MNLVRRPFLPGLLLGLVVMAAAPLAAPGPARTLLIRNATVLPMDGSSPLSGQAVTVVGGRIGAVVPDAELDPPAGATVVDAAGGFLLPGLADMHVHIGEPDLELLLAHGVTTARVMNGSKQHLAWRDQIAAGDRLGPRLLVASPLLAGEAVPRVRHELLESPEAARERVGALATAGYDLIKVYDGLDVDTYDALVREAAAQGLPITGHVPEDVGLGRTLHARQDLEHVEKIVHAARGPLDATTLPFLAAHIRDAGVRVTPTLAAQRALAMVGTAAYRDALEAPETRWVADATLEWWRTLSDAPRDGHGPDPTGFYRLQEQLAVALFRAGVPLLVGSDTPNPLMLPGISLIDELEALVGAGLEPREALELATAGAGRYLGEALQRPETVGVIRPGAGADLVLLDADPLESLEALRRPRGVVAAGRWLDRRQLDAMLADVARCRGDAGARPDAHGPGHGGDR